VTIQLIQRRGLRLCPTRDEDWIILEKMDKIAQSIRVQAEGAIMLQALQIEVGNVGKVEG